MLINIALWLSGFVLLALAIFRIRAPLARMSELDRLAENAKRYESWRGGRSSTTAETHEETGADVMRSMLRRQVLIWATVGVLGIVLIFAGFVVR
jgi:hypothetical protein